MEPTLVLADKVVRIPGRFSHDLTANRAVQLSAVACLHHLTLTWGLHSLPISMWAKLTAEALHRVAPDLAVTLLPTLAQDLAATIGDLGTCSSGLLRLERPVRLAIPNPPVTVVARMALALLDLQEELLARQWLRPVFHLQALANAAEQNQTLQEQLKSKPCTRFVATAGWDRQEIRNAIRQGLEGASEKVDLMMAYIDSEEGNDLFTPLVRSLYQKPRLQVRLLLRDEPDNIHFRHDLLNKVQGRAIHPGEAHAVLERIGCRFVPSNTVTRLHAKLWIFDDTSAIISSANLLPSSMQRNIEAGVYTEDPGVLRDVCRFFEEIWNQYGQP